MLALEDKLPRAYWVEINRLLVPFGKHICTGQAPKCSTCPVLDMCQQVGVGGEPVSGAFAARCARMLMASPFP